MFVVSERLVNYMLPYTYNCVVLFFYMHVFLHLHLPNWSTNDQMNSHAFIMKFNGSWHVQE